jgi:hypothetical protein
MHGDLHSIIIIGCWHHRNHCVLFRRRHPRHKLGLWVDHGHQAEYEHEHYAEQSDCDSRDTNYADGDGDGHESRYGNFADRHGDLVNKWVDRERVMHSNGKRARHEHLHCDWTCASDNRALHGNCDVQW